MSGEKGSALVCAEGELQGGRVELTMLTIDAPSLSGPVVIKDASEQKLQVRVRA